MPFKDFIPITHTSTHQVKYRHMITQTAWSIITFNVVLYKY